MTITAPATQIARTWHRRLQIPVWRHSWCRRWAQAVVPISKGIDAAGQRTNLDEFEALELVAAFPSEGVRLEPNHELAGVEWLRRYPGRACVMTGPPLFPDTPHGESQPPGVPADYADHIDHFTFNGEAALNIISTYHGRGARARGATPVWRCHMKPDSPYPGVDYHAASWQQERFG